MAFGRKPDRVVNRNGLAGGALYLPPREEVEAILARAGTELGEPDLEAFELVRERMGTLEAHVAAEAGEREIFAGLDLLIEAIDAAVSSPRVRHAAKVAVRNVLARCGIRPIRVAPGDALARLDRVEVEVEETRVHSRRHDADAVERVERRGWRLASGEILRPARVVASAGRRPELLDFADGVRRFRTGLGEAESAACAALLAEFDARGALRRDDLLALFQTAEDATGRLSAAREPIADKVREIFVDPLTRVLAAERIAEPFGEEGADPRERPEGAVRIEKEEYSPGSPRGRITRVLARGLVDPASGKVLAPARVAVARGEPPDLARSLQTVAAAAARLASLDGEESARRLVGSLESLAPRLGSLSRADLDAITSALADLDRFLAEFVHEDRALAPGDGAVAAARDLVVDLSHLLGGWGYAVFPDPRLVDPALASIEDLRRERGETAVEIEGVHDDSIPAGRILFVRAHGLASETEGLASPAVLAVSLGPRPPVLETLERLEGRLGSAGEAAEAIREKIDRFRASLAETADHRTLVKLVNLLDAALADGDLHSPSCGTPQRGDLHSPSCGTPQRGDLHSPSCGTPQRGDLHSSTSGTPQRGDLHSPSSGTPQRGGDPGLGELAERLVGHLREAGIEERRIEPGIPFDSLPPDLYHVRKVWRPDRAENEVVRVLQRAFLDRGGLLLQQARIEVNVREDGR